MPLAPGLRKFANSIKYMRNDQFWKQMINDSEEMSEWISFYKSRLGLESSSTL